MLEHVKWFTDPSPYPTRYGPLGHLPFFGIMFLPLMAPNANTRRLGHALRPAA